MIANLSGKTALVTGGASGLGVGIGKVLGECGAKIALADLNFEQVEIAAAQLDRMGWVAKPYGVDVTDHESVQGLVDRVVGELGQIDILVNSAGTIGAPGWEETTTFREEDWDVTYRVNVKGTALVSVVVAEHMKGRRYGKIVNVSSQGGRPPSGEGGSGAFKGGGSIGGDAYAASKAAVIRLTHSFALELAPWDINVNCICPGSIWTPMWERIASRTKQNDPTLRDLTPRELFDRFVKACYPFRREQTPEDMGKAIAFLVSDDARNITGQALNVDGGRHMN